MVLCGSSVSVMLMLWVVLISLFGLYMWKVRLISVVIGVRVM